MKSMFPSPVLEMQDPSLFDFDYSSTIPTGVYDYNVLLADKKVSRNQFMKIMQEDLSRAFGLQANIEEREMPAWILARTKGNHLTALKLETKGGPAYNSAKSESQAAGFSARNVNVNEIMATAIAYIKDRTDYPFRNETGIHGNLDITISGDLTTFEGITAALAGTGLSLTLEKRLMRVLVIRDSHSGD
ncbi:MAG: DUF3738 domain-containing protein [Chryseolinea sp.]